MHCLAFGTYDVTRHPRVAVLLEGLRAHGDRVTEVNEPLRLDTAARVAILHQPWRAWRLAARLVLRWSRLAVRARRVARRRKPDAVLVGYLGHFDVRLARLLFPGTPVVLDHLVSAVGTARDREAGLGALRTRLMAAIDDGALRRADLVVVDTAEDKAVLPEPARHRAVVVPVGAAGSWFRYGERRGVPGDDATARPAPGGGPLRVVFVGLFTPLHGAPAIGEALAELAGDDRIQVTMVGTGQDYARCRRLAAGNPRVTWIDWVPGDRLPDLVAGHDVCLGIFGTTPKALRVVPTKVYQGAAAGCAVVTSDTAPQRAALPDAALFVPPGDSAALAAALRRLAGDRDELARLMARARSVALARYTPATVVSGMRERMLAMIRPAPARRRVRAGQPDGPVPVGRSGGRVAVGRAGEAAPVGLTGERPRARRPG